MMVMRMIIVVIDYQDKGCSEQVAEGVLQHVEAGRRVEVSVSE